MSLDAGGLAHFTPGYNSSNNFGLSNTAGYGSRGKAQHMKRLSVAPPPNINSIDENQVDVQPAPRTSRSHLLAGLRTAPKQGAAVPASAPYNQQNFNPHAASFAGRSNINTGLNVPQTAVSSHFPQAMNNACNGYGYQNMYASSEQVLAPPSLGNTDQMDPEVYHTLLAQKMYLMQRQQQLQQQLMNVTNAAQQFQGMNLNSGHHVPATPITPQPTMYSQQIQAGLQPIVQPTSQAGVYNVYNPLTGQHTLYYENDIMSPMSPTQTPGLSTSPDPEIARFRPMRRDNDSPPSGLGPNRQRPLSPPKGTPSPQQDVTPLPPPSANAFRPGHRKSTSQAVTGLKALNTEGLKSAEPRSAFPFTPRTGTFGPGLARAGEHPIRQPRGPPPMDELVAAPTSKHEGSKNFASRQRRRAVHDLVRAGKERRSGRNGSTGSGAGTPSSESEINFVISSDADSEGASSATTGSGSLSGDPSFDSLKTEKAIGQEWKELKERAHDALKPRPMSVSGPRDFASALKATETQDGGVAVRRKSPLLVLASAAEKRKSFLY